VVRKASAKQAHERTEPADAATLRAEKVARYKREKEVRAPELAPSRAAAR
jgi:hypothetical protein